MIYGSHILFAHSQAERGRERGGRGGNRTKVHGVVVLESERGEGGGGMLLADGFVVWFEEGGTIKYAFGESILTAKN